MVLNYEVNNPTDRKVTYKCMVTYDPPTSKTPGCILKEVVLEPGQRFTGSIVSTAEFPVETGAEVKLIDENDKVVSVQYIPIIRVIEPVKAECGSGLCDSGEDYKSCPDDCSSGGADGYCDGVKDGICDIDCAKDSDSDCNRADILSYLPYVVAGLLVVVVLVYVGRKKSEARRVEEEREEFLKWKQEKGQ